MHDDFSAWLGGVNVHLTNEVAISRWGAVEALVRWTTEPQKALRLSACAIAVASVTGEQRLEISRILQGGDASLSMKDNDAEVQVLA